MREREEWKPGNMLYPCPIAMISTRGKDNKSNIFTVAWTGTICTNPPMAYISVRPERYSYNAIKETGEFVINLVTDTLTFAADFCGVRSGRDYDKFSYLHLTERKVEGFNSPAIDESPVNIMCKVKDILPLGSHHMVVCDVVGVSIDKKYLDDNKKFHLELANLVCYSHGDYILMGKKIGKFGYSVEKKK